MIALGSKDNEYREFFKKIEDRYHKNNTLITEALNFVGKTASGKTLMEISLDSKTSAEDKALLH